MFYKKNKIPEWDPLTKDLSQRLIESTTRYKITIETGQQIPDSTETESKCNVAKVKFWIWKNNIPNAKVTTK